MIYQIAKPFFFKMDPETVHDWTLKQFSQRAKLLKKFFKPYTNHQGATGYFLDWRNPLALAAGFDKNAVALEFLDYLGFGAIEVGTVTLKPQAGNEKPRLFRDLKNQALRNSLGFPSMGAQAVLANVAQYEGEADLGINLGKNKDTALSAAAGEYAELMKIFEPYADYLVINISSPNTENLRLLQDKAYLTELLQEVNGQRSLKKPLLVKISPDEDESVVKNIYQCCLQNSVQGIIATNTTKQHEYGVGGVSGPALYPLSAKTWKKLLEWVGSDRVEFDIVGAGGFSTREQFQAFQKSGGQLIQVYTSFIFQGPHIFEMIAP